MTEPERKKWRLEHGPDWLLVMDGGYEVARISAHSERAEADAARIVALNNADGEPVAWSYELAGAKDPVTGQYCAWSSYIAFIAPNAGSGQRNVRPLYYATYPAPEPPAEVEWRVSEAEINSYVGHCSPVIRSLARDLRDAHAALACRADPTPATPVIDETRDLIGRWDITATNKDRAAEFIAIDKALHPGAPINRLRLILAEHDAVAARRPGEWREGWIAGRDTAADEITKDLAPSSIVHLVDRLEERIRALAPPVENEEDRG